MATQIITAEIKNHDVVSSQEWKEKRVELLKKEKELTRLFDDIKRQRRELPWEKVTRHYVFDGPNGKESLADLFDGRNQLIIYHFMFAPEWQEGCPSCSLVAENFDSNLLHLADRDVAFLAVSRAPLAKIQQFQRRMGWNFKWLSSYSNEFNRDFHVSFTNEEVAKKEMYYNYTNQYFPQQEGPGLSVFYKDGSGNVFHTYSTFGRGLEALLGVYNFLDMTPKGRNEEGLSFPMAWVRHHDRYPQNIGTQSQKSAGTCCGGEHRS
jgi:predicted dithiol-disulfide oxidoreductase (DUF899 family)